MFCFRFGFRLFPFLFGQVMAAVMAETVFGSDLTAAAGAAFAQGAAAIRAEKVVDILCSAAVGARAQPFL